MSELNPKSVSMILIGNELLSGKIIDENGIYAAKRLRALGAELVRIVVVPDVEDDIVHEIQRCRQRSELVLTSGGVGPTHDDITLACVAKALNEPLVRHPRLENLIRTYFAARATPDHFRMADLPAGAELIDAGTQSWPIIRCDNLFILPGVPEIFRAKFEAIAPLLRQGEWFLRSVYLNADEGTIAADLREMEIKFGVSIGSYPRFRADDYRVRVTVEARQSSPVDDACAYLLDRLPDGVIVRIDPELTAL
ncbi:MAG: competence/damage-inducible protein A [Myxococcota bacterium]|nr:competence/damage-inducible protein A [Myxococcota bacterium]